MSRKYTAEQIEALKRYYPTGEYDKLSPFFPDKTKRQIKSVARRYGIKSNNPGHRLDLSGQRFGMLVVDSFAYVKDYKSYWNCKCDCGKEIIANGQLINSGLVKSCGCLINNPKPRVNHVGERYGRLTAIERIPKYKSGRTYYKCLCDCGNTVCVSSSSLVGGKTKSCGCAQKSLKDFWTSIGHVLNDDDKVFSVYKHTAPNGKVYIGITRQNASRRWQNGYGYKTQKYFYKAITKYGWDSFKHEVLETSLTEKEACEKEQFYIKKFKSNDPHYGYNITQGGDTSTNKVQPVLLCMNGVPIHFFESITATADEFELTSPAIRKYIESPTDYAGYSFRKLPKMKLYDITDEMYDINTSDNDLEKAKKAISEVNRSRLRIKKRKNNIPICQYELSGRFVRTFKSLGEARELYPNLGSREISGTGKSKTAYGYIWRYDNGDHSDIEPIIINGVRRKVQQVDPKTNNVIRIFDSLAEAERYTNISRKQICKACRGLHKTSGGYIWRYFDEVTEGK